MKFSLLIMCMTVFTYFLRAENFQFLWFNRSEHQFHKIDLKTMEYSTRSMTGQFQLIGKVNLNNVAFHDIPSVTYNVVNFNNLIRDPESINYFPLNQNITLLSLSGTGQVYKFERGSLSLTRIDQTFFRGYNFLALQFLDRGTLYSFGGSGFWQVNATLTYFDFKRKEWELILPKGSNVPLRTTNEYSGYRADLHKVYAIETVKEYAIENEQESNFFVLDLKSMTWEYKGKISLSKLAKYAIGKSNTLWIDPFFLFKDRGGEVVFADPEENKLYTYRGTKKLFFGPAQRLFAHGKMIYSIRSQFTQGTSVEVVDSLSIQQILKESVVLDTFYDEPILPWGFKDISLAFLGCLVLASGMYVIKNKRNNRPTGKNRAFVSAEEGIWDILSPSGRSILDFVIEHGSNYMFSTEEISMILGCDKKAFDTQRQYRSKFISHFNSFFEENFHLSNAIYRISSEEDKRFVCYQVSENAIKEYRNYLKNLD